VAVAAVGLLLVSPRGQLELPELVHVSAVMSAFGVALALAAGLARLTNPEGGVCRRPTSACPPRSASRL
jgi:hypothetical protein